MTSGFTKLYNQIITSSIWSEDDKVRIMWITILASSDPDGYVSGSIPGMAAIARMSLQDAERSIKALCSPDRYSRSKEHKGRRLEEVDGGWLILNYSKYRAKRDPEERRQQNRDAQARYRRKQKISQSKPDISQDKPKTEDRGQKTEKDPPISPLGDGQPKGSNIPEAVQKVFDHWNSYAGRAVEKPNGQGGVKSIRWLSHRKFGKDKRQAIEQALKDYPIEDVCGAIDNFATVLMGREYYWSYPWTLHEFLTRGEEKHKAAARKWWAWLPDNFDPERYHRQGAEDEVQVNDFTPEEAEEFISAHERPLTPDEFHAQWKLTGWPPLGEDEFNSLPRTSDGKILLNSELRGKWEKAADAREKERLEVVV